MSYPYDSNCPVCGLEMESYDFQDDPHGTVESWEECKGCRVLIGHSYGQYEMTVGNESYGFHYNSDDWEIIRAEIEFEHACNQAKRRKP